MDEVVLRKNRWHGDHSPVIIKYKDVEPLHLHDGEKIEITVKRIEPPQEAD